MKRRKLIHHGFPGEIKDMLRHRIHCFFHSFIFFGSTVSLTVLATIPWDFSPRKWAIDSLSCDSLRIAKALFRSRLSSIESANTFDLFEASQSSLMIRFLLV